jgi:nitrile hydratase subunit beta
MNGVHDMGGMHGFGRVEPEPDEPVFHAPWEGRAFAMNRAMGYLGLWSIDIGRFSRETLPPHVYLGSSYYKKWTLGLENLCLQFGLVGEDELAAGHALHPPPYPPPLGGEGREGVKRTLAAADVPKTLSRGRFDRPPPAPAKFEPGDPVRTRNINPPSHTRLPRYARGHTGAIECIRGCHVFPDAVATGKGEDPQWLYTVVFDGRELWGEAADPTVKVSIEAWEPYLEIA